jgi:hypothetical protein
MSGRKEEEYILRDDVRRQLASGRIDSDEEGLTKFVTD